MISISKLIEKVEKINPNNKEGSWKYIDIASVDRFQKKIVLDSVSLITTGSAPSRARQLVFADDIIISTVRPNLNTVAIVPKELDGAIASTGFCILRPNKEMVDTKYLFHYIKSDDFVNKLVKLATGANYPAVSDKIIKEQQLKKISLCEQKNIAAILDKAEGIRQKREQAIKLADDFLRATFLDMFGDAVENPKGWKKDKIKKGVLDITSGWSATGGNIPCRSDEFGVLKISSVTSGVFKPEENKVVDRETIPASKKLIFPQKGDLLFSRANTRELVAAICMVHQDYDNLFLPDKLWSIKLNHELLLPEFFLILIQNEKVRELLTKQATGTSGSMLNISKNKFEETEIIFP
ncbi:restriction endonuclease subunit S, partial [Salmonella enterica]|nr:hypothetical protein [Salmonella enterica]EIP1706594.1 restriction endonuclease subunit S [Salmonella enterica]EIS0324830.1 restriction endonuclease subunit S [Salmonella enterica]EKO1910733.1 restriction endonuclease subunit S [Salmonella enterica]